MKFCLNVVLYLRFGKRETLTQDLIRHPKGYIEVLVHFVCLKC